MKAIDGSVEEAVTVVTLSGELDASDLGWADELRDTFDGGIDCVVIDLRGVSFVDSSFARELLIAHRRLAPHGWLRVVYTHHLVGRVIDICGLAAKFPQFTTVEAAIRDMPRRDMPRRTEAGRA